ncbi:uncharacterized protein LOC110453006 isoform X2 [Mizuhopecten yessoensis]|uniref:uncharacterized protein LOC110453006 isoform X2 n=1 Tax=Mizuhopecten yessoensis TaxID=6573 RepID=UPI000B45D9D7|nr:uncharacterized protein LOC110453006 isoform X2 [Mizuhopecten yessoensis]
MDMLRHQLCIIVITVVLVLLRVCESGSLALDCRQDTGKGCGRTPVTKPQGEEDVTVITPPENAEEHRDNCTNDEYFTQGCLNGGKCFVVVIDSIRLLNCHCPSDYIGKRCELFDFQPGGQEEGKDRIATAGVAVLTVAGVLFVTVLIFIAIWRKRYLRKKSSEKAKDKEKLHDQDPMRSNGSPSYFPQVRGEGWTSTGRQSPIPEAIPLTTMVNEKSSS